MQPNNTKNLNISGIDEAMQKKTKQSFFAKVKFFAFPLFLLIIWPSLLVFEIIPRLNANKDFYNSNISYFSENIKALQKDNSTDVATNLNLLNSWIPTTSGSISTLEDEFRSLASNYGVNIKDFKAGESITKATQDLLKTLQLTENTEVLRSVPLEFNASGDLNNLLNFINNIQHYNTFNSFKSLKISTIAGNWNAKMVLVRYYFSENFKIDQTKQSVSPIDQTFLKNLQERAKVN